MMKAKAQRPKIAEAVEFIYTVHPAITVTDLAFTQKLNRRVAEAAAQVAYEKGLAVPFTFAIGDGLLKVEATPLSYGVPIDPDQTRITVRRQEKSPGKTDSFSPKRSSSPHQRMKAASTGSWGLIRSLETSRRFSTS